MNIVVGYIDTPEGRAALDTAIAEARARDGHLLIVRSLTGKEPGEDVFATDEELAGLDEELAEAGVSYEIRELIRGKRPGEDIASFANEHGADRLVIGLRRRSPVGKFVLGSNAEDILLQADCPVLAVKADSGS